MEFDKSRVYTALNADELEVGSKVIVADNITSLKELVACGDVCILQNIATANSTFRFIAEDNGESYAFAYLVEEPEEKKLKWTDLKIGDVITNAEKSATFMVTRIDANIDREVHIFAGNIWLRDDDLKNWEKVEK